MTETEREPTPEHEPKLDREVIITSLQELGVDIELEDWKDDDDNDVLGHIASLALMYDLDIDETYDALGITVEQPEEQE